MKLPVLSGKKAIKTLSKLGFEITGKKGSHVKMRKITDKNKAIVIIIPDHKELATGTLNDIIKQAGLTREEFIKLI